MTDLPRTIVEAAAAIRSGVLTAEALTAALLRRADRLDPQLGVFVHRCDDSALEAARRADEELAAGFDRGPLHGVPVAVKDILATADAPTTAQSLVLPRSWGAGRDATVVRRLRDAGAVILGKTTTMEFAIGLPDPTKPFPVPRNPWDPGRWAGGSSSGSASGVAAGLFLGAVGTDTGGSIRLPAALCGVTGLKPTFGLVPRTGCVPLATSLDHVGPLARTAHDCAILLDALSGHDPQDPGSADRPPAPVTSSLDGSLAGLRIGVEREHHLTAQGVDPEVARCFEEALEELRAAGADVREVSLPLFEALAAACVVVLFSEAFAYHRDSLRARWQDYGSSTRLMVATGAFFSSTDLVQAHRVLRRGRVEVARLLGEVDVLVTPTVGVGAPSVNGLDLVTAFGMPVFTPIYNGLGLPALSVPAGFTDAGLPAGLQVVGRPFDDATVLRVGHAYQQRTSWHLRTPEPAAARNEGERP